MDTARLISSIEAQLLGRELTAVECWVFEQTWQGNSYLVMARESSYSTGYLKAVGAGLWSDLSDVLQVAITKKNLRWVIRQAIAGESILPPPPLSSAQKFDPTPPADTSPTSAPPELHLERLIPFPSGPVPLNSELYIERSVDAWAYRELQNPGCLLRIHGPARTGKTSLLIRLLKQAEDWNYSTAFIDFQTVDHSMLENLDSFLRWFCLNLTRQTCDPAGLPSEIESFWEPELGSSLNCTEYIEEKILRTVDQPIVLALNEVNQALGHWETMQDFLSLLRFWHEQSQHRLLWQKLRLVLVYSSDCYIPLRLDRSPFNVGRSLRLPPLTLAEIQRLALHHGFDWARGQAGLQTLSPLAQLLGGNPYLTRLAFYHLHESSMTVGALLQQAITPDGPYRSYLRERKSFLDQEPRLATALNLLFDAKGNESHKTKLSPRDIYRLESAGFVRYEGASLVPSCELYRQYFESILA